MDSLDLQTTKTLGGVGALLMVISPFLAVYSAVLGLVGLILVLIAMKGLADHYNDSGIFNNALYGVLSTIVGVAAFAVAMFVTLIDFFRDLGLEITEDWSDPTIISQIQFQDAQIFDSFVTHAAAILGSLVILFIFIVISAIFLRKSLTSISEKTGVGLFGTTGLLLLIGAVLTIIIIGGVIIWVSYILLAIAFFSIKTEPAPQPQTAQPMPNQ